MKNYLELFRNMADEIANHPLLELREFTTYASAQAETFTAINGAFGVPLSETIQGFFQQTNGLNLRWGIKSGFPDDELDTIIDKYDDYAIELPEDEEIPFAQIKIPSIEAIFFDLDWKKVILCDLPSVNFARVTYDSADFVQKLRPFDLFSTYECMSFFMEQGNGNPKVLLLSDYYIDWQASRITDFESYLEVLLATRGIGEGRKNYFEKYLGHKKAPLVLGAKDWPTLRTPKLFNLRGRKK